MTTLQSYSPITAAPLPHTNDLEIVVCDYCGHDNTTTLASLPPPEELLFPMHRLGASALDLSGQEIRFCRCNNCGLVYMNPRLTESAIARFYDKVYSNAGASEGFSSQQTQRSSYLLDITAEYMDTANPRPSLLDIGCGGGQFLYAAQQRGWQVYGSELSSVAAQAASARLNVPIHVGDYREMSLAPASLDVVTLLEVAEHLRAPIDFIRDAAALLKPNGILVLEVPNIDSMEYAFARRTRQLWRGFIIEHLYYFTPDFMRRLMSKLDMEILRLSSRHAIRLYPNPVRDAYQMFAATPDDETAFDAANSEPIPALPPVSLPRRIIRQLNNYLLDFISVVSEGAPSSPRPRGNTLYVWARKRD